MDLLHPVERGSGIGKLADPVVETALAAAHTARIETQRGKTARREILVQRHGDAIVHRPARFGMRVEDHGDGCARTRTGLETTFETTFGAGKNDAGHERFRCKKSLLRVPHSALNATRD